MNQSYARLRKKWIKESIGLLVTILLLVGGTYYFEIINEEAKTEQQAAESETNAARVKLIELRNELQNGNILMSLYENYIKYHSQNFTLNRENATRWLVTQKERFHLTNLSITIPPFTDISKDAIPSKSGVFVKSDIKLAFSALTDNSVLSLIEAMQREMPGVVVMQDVLITKTADITANVVMELSRHRITPLVKAELSLTWLGLRNEVKNVNAPNAPPK